MIDPFLIVMFIILIIVICGTVTMGRLEHEEYGLPKTSSAPPLPQWYLSGTTFSNDRTRPKWNRKLFPRCRRYAKFAIRSK